MACIFEASHRANILPEFLGLQCGWTASNKLIDTEAEVWLYVIGSTGVWCGVGRMRVTRIREGGRRTIWLPVIDSIRRDSF
jgi:hypothetical protein